MAFTEQQKKAILHPIRWVLSKEPDQPGEIPRRELLFYALGFMGQGQGNGMAGGDKFFHFCTNVLKLDPVAVGRMTGATTLFDALNDPVAGAVIDNYRFKDGRKLLPWVKLTVAPIAVLGFLLFINWGLPSAGLRLLYSAFIYVMWDICYSFQDAALWGMSAAISPRSDQRARAIQWADIGGLVGGVLVEFLLPMLSGNGAFGLSQQQVYLMFAFVLCLCGGFQTYFAMGTKERVRSLPEAEGARSLWRNFGALRHNYILWLFLASELLDAIAPNLAEIYVFQQLSYQMGGKTVPAPVIVAILVSLTGIPGSVMKLFAAKVAERAGGMKRMLFIGRVMDIVTRVLAYAAGIKTLPGVIMVYVLEGISTLPNGIYNIALRSMISDSVEYVEWKTGQRTEGITMSTRNLMAKMKTAIRSFIQGWCLHFLQFSADNVELGRPQNAHYHKWVFPIFKLGPALGAVLALIPLLFLRYPDSLKLQVESEMAQRRAAVETVE